jgi:hypothetical protein
MTAMTTGYVGRFSVWSASPMTVPAAISGQPRAGVRVRVLDDRALPSLGVAFRAEVAYDSLGDVAERLDLLA